MSRYDFSASGVKLKPRMQNDVAYSTASARIGTSAMSSSQPQPYGGVYSSVYSSSIFGPKPSSVAPYGVQSNSDTSQAYRNKLYQSLLVQNRQEMVNRHSLCLKRLHEAAEEADALRRENSHLRNVNVELNKQLSLLIHASIQKEIEASSSSVQRSPFGIVNGIRGLSIDGKSSAQEEEELSDQSPTSEEAENVDVERISLPKSISVRSNGYVKLPPVTAATNAAARIQTAARSRIAKAISASQKVYVQGGKKEEVPLELEVFNQGMFKTELCNKWQESGDCPYKDHCQFAHGVEELRPVIRHPRYKTEVCRMVLAGDVCPYGHRCHFRHALTEEEKELAGGNNTPSRPIR
ncbi:putative transcription factor C3H family [Rosa chinensis]|uniref:Putative transcription factor C3H family n=1 Tax=Rosa chinensis TaxID=74649 RepID=A0A2P6R1F8_ROSCH|nr:zinc finger CCCH domain-containing protein 15 [Rosa chinensis]PRQ40263.1 putative transcription factor C3H family [Rosa chinensis]